MNALLSTYCTEHAPGLVIFIILQITGKVKIKKIVNCFKVYM